MEMFETANRVACCNRQFARSPWFIRIRLHGGSVEHLCLIEDASRFLARRRSLRYLSNPVVRFPDFLDSLLGTALRTIFRPVLGTFVLLVLARFLILARLPNGTSGAHHEQAGSQEQCWPDKSTDCDSHDCCLVDCLRRRWLDPITPGGICRAIAVLVLPIPGAMSVKANAGPHLALGVGFAETDLRKPHIGGICVSWNTSAGQSRFVWIGPLGGGFGGIPPQGGGFPPNTM